MCAHVNAIRLSVLRSQWVIADKSHEYQGVAVPRFGFSGGSFSTNQGGRNFTQSRAVYCGDCCEKIGTVDCPEEVQKEERRGETREEESQEQDEVESDGEEEEKEGEEEEEDNEEDEADDDGLGKPARVTVSKQSIQGVGNNWAAPGEVHVQHSFKQGEYPLYRETRTQYSSPCMGCWISQGPVWMLRGMGNKSRKKTKGFKKITKRDLSLHTD